MVAGNLERWREGRFYEAVGSIKCSAFYWYDLIFLSDSFKYRTVDVACL